MHPLVPVFLIGFGLVILFFDCRRMNHEQFFAYIRGKVHWWIGYIFCAAIVIGALAGLASLSEQAMLWVDVLSIVALAIAVFLYMKKNRRRAWHEIPPALRGKL